jgi:NADH-quinone oxidoreductase subunit A
MEMGLALPIFLLGAGVFVLAMGMLAMAMLFNPNRPGAVKQMPYESGMDPVHDTRRRFDVRFHLLAIAFLVFDVELLFLYPWAVAMRPANVAGTLRVPSAEVVQGTADGTQSVPATLQGIDAAVASGLASSRDAVFAGAMLFIALLALGFLYDWRKGVFQWR